MGRKKKIFTDSEKECSWCYEIKPLEAFSPNKKTASGRSSRCKLCLAADSRKRYQANREKNIARAARWRRENPEKVRRAGRRYSRVRTIEPRKMRARQTATRLIKRGLLTPLPCQVCGEEKTDAHHIDYTYPTAIAWLCRPHHLAWHRVFEAD